MPARKPDLPEVPHFQAVQMAPDSELKRQVVEHATRIMAGRQRMLEMDAEVCHAVLTRYYERSITPPAADADKPSTREVSVAQALRASSRGGVIRKDMDRLIQSAYQEAREAAYERTGIRVGPRFWPMQEAARKEQAELEKNEPAQQATPAPSPNQALARREPNAAEAPRVDFHKIQATNKYIKFAEEEMLRGGVPKEQCMEVLKICRQEQWSVAKLYGVVGRLLQETVVA